MCGVGASTTVSSGVGASAVGPGGGADGGVPAALFAGGVAGALPLGAGDRCAGPWGGTGATDVPGGGGKGWVSMADGARGGE
jgi:hypothetical protein